MSEIPLNPDSQQHLKGHGLKHGKGLLVKVAEQAGRAAGSQGASTYWASTFGDLNDRYRDTLLPWKHLHHVTLNSYPITRPRAYGIL